jgi:hypothetical protein
MQIDLRQFKKTASKHGNYSGRIYPCVMQYETIPQDEKDVYARLKSEQINLQMFFWKSGIQNAKEYFQMNDKKK